MCAARVLVPVTWWPPSSDPPTLPCLRKQIWVPPPARNPWPIPQSLPPGSRGHLMRPSPLLPAPRTLRPHRHRCLPQPPPSELLHHQEEEPPSGLAFDRRDEPGEWGGGEGPGGPGFALLRRESFRSPDLRPHVPPSRWVAALSLQHSNHGSVGTPPLFSHPLRQPMWVAASFECIRHVAPSHPRLSKSPCPSPGPPRGPPRRAPHFCSRPAPWPLRTPARGSP